MAQTSYPRGTLSAVARRLRLTLSHVSRVASGQRESPKIRAAIAREVARRASHPKLTEAR